jgi:hypothetical protein
MLIYQQYKAYAPMAKMLRTVRTASWRQAVPIVVLVAFIGVVVALTTLAASPLAAFEIENGTLTGGATKVVLSGASGGQIVRFVSGSTSSGSLNLPTIPWEGGSAYWKQFPKADAAGWDDPSFFPIVVFMANPEHSAQLKALGVNVLSPPEHRVGTLSYVDATPGMFIMPGDEWTPAEVGNRANAVGWYISDECEMGYTGCGDGDQYSQLAIQQGYVATRKSYNDGRFMHANFGNGILRTFWGPDTMPQHMALMDSASSDKYMYTSPHIWEIVPNSPDWPAGAVVARAASYGWQVDQMKRFQDPAKLKPIWTNIETARPYLTEPGALTIQPNQLEGAVWSAIIHEARGISYFQHNNDDSLGCTGTYSMVDCANTAFGQALMAKVTFVDSQIRSLAPVINTQSYAYNFNSGTDTMLKTYNGSAYIFSGIGIKQTTGNKTFTLPTGISGTTVEVVDENRTITVSGGKFTDNFASEYTHHIYKIAL